MFRIIDHYAPNFSSSVIGRDVLSPWDLEQVFGLTGGVRAVPAAKRGRLVRLTCGTPLFARKSIVAFPEHLPWQHGSAPALLQPARRERVRLHDAAGRLLPLRQWRTPWLVHLSTCFVPTHRLIALVYKVFVPYNPGGGVMGAAGRNAAAVALRYRQ